MLRWVAKVIGQGLAALIPMVLTIGLVYWIGAWAVELLAKPLKEIFPESKPSHLIVMGIAGFLATLFLFGLLMRLWLVRKLFAMIESWFTRLPLVKTIFGAIKDVTKFLSGGEGGSKGDMVVLVDIGNGIRQVGIVTRQDFASIPSGLFADEPGIIAVYIPFSYQMGGFTYFLDRSNCTPVPGMSVEDAMRFSIMAWLGSAKTPTSITMAKGENIASRVSHPDVVEDGR